MIDRPAHEPLSYSTASLCEHWHLHFSKRKSGTADEIKRNTLGKLGAGLTDVLHRPIVEGTAAQRSC